MYQQRAGFASSPKPQDDLMGWVTEPLTGDSHPDECCRRPP